LNGDLHSETHLWEAPGGTPKIQERAVNIESEYDYGSRSGVWRLFRLFNKHNFKYTLYAVGKAIEDNPAVGISSVKNGHDVASHAYRWIDYADMSPEKEKAYIKKEIENNCQNMRFASKGLVLRTVIEQISSSGLGSLQRDGRASSLGLGLIRR